MPTDLKKSAIRIIVMLISALCIIVMVCFSLIDIVPKSAITKGHMQVIGNQILRFNRVYHRLPVSLDELAATNSDPGTMLDGWGRPIQYLPQTNGIVSLKSISTNIEVSFSVTNIELLIPIKPRQP